LRTRIRRDVFTERRIQEAIFEHYRLMQLFYNDFERAHGPSARSGSADGTPLDKNRRSSWKVQDSLFGIGSYMSKYLDDDVDRQIFTTIALFNSVILKTNFYARDKCALVFRLEPSFFHDRKDSFPAAPFALFLLVGSTFRGFHVRFRDVARGGIRCIRSANSSVFSRNLETLFRENYNLAYTQQCKNKDIPEGGSKGTLLLSLAHQDAVTLAFQSYVDTLLSCVLPCKEIVDYYGEPEMLFLGPDEGTADFMNWAALHAKRRGYKYWKSFCTGKTADLGGIPHDIYGMTTRSVHQYVLGTLKKLGLEEKDITKLQTGGPDGDLGSNEILISKDKTIAVVDGSGVLFDPEGIDRRELERLAKQRVMVEKFRTDLLSDNGLRVLVTETDIMLPDGTMVESGLHFRNVFHLSQYALQAFAFVPCGGRPEAVNINNVSALLTADKNRTTDCRSLRSSSGGGDDGGGGLQSAFKVIVEGANLFFTQDARLALEKAGAILYKDASANKGGVTSSSLEVLAALALNDEEFNVHMVVQVDEAKRVVPEFYEAYVKQVQKKIEENAALEFECIWREHERTMKPRCVLSDLLSQKINQLNDRIQGSTLWDNEKLRNTILYSSVPSTLLKLIGGLDVLLERVPEHYTRAVFASYLAARYIYNVGFDAPSSSFYLYVKELINSSK